VSWGVFGIRRNDNEMKRNAEIGSFYEAITFSLFNNTGWSILQTADDTYRTIDIGHYWIIRILRLTQMTHQAN